MARLALGRALGSFVVASAIALACLAPTQVTVAVTTDVDCATVTQNGTSLYSGDPASAPPVSTTRACKASSTDNEIGTLVVTPAGDADDRVTVAVALGVRRPSEECAANAYKGCILAKRRFRFVAHEPLDMPIQMALSCLDVACSPDETCFRGACISADVEAREGCLGPDCSDRIASRNDATVNESDAPTIAADAGADVADGSTAIPDAVAFTTADGVLMTPFVPNVRARGLAIYDGDLYWTVEGTAPAYHCPLDAAVPSSLGTVPGDYSAISVGLGGYVVAGVRPGSTNACAFYHRLDGGSIALECDGGDPGFGVAVHNVIYVSSLDAGRVHAFDRSTGAWLRDVAVAAHHVEGQSFMAHVPTSTGIYTWEGTTNPAVQNAAMPDAGHGIAVDGTWYFITSRDGHVWRTLENGAVDRVPLEILRGAFTRIEDIVFDATTSTFYISAERADGSRAIWQFDRAALLLP